MKRIFYVFPLLFLLAACSPEEVEFTIKDKFITDVVINAEGFPTTEDATDRGYRNLIDPSYKVFIEFSRRGRTHQTTCKLDQVYWRYIQTGQTFSKKMTDSAKWACGNLYRAIHHNFKQQSEE